jgi:stage V sporulation protein AF
MADQNKISRDIEKNINYLKELLGVGESFDIIFREFYIGRKKIVTYSVNAMVNDDLMSDILEDIVARSPEELTVDTLDKIFYHRATHTQTKKQTNMTEAVISLLSGELIMFVDGEDTCIIIDARKYPARLPAESNIEKVTRGSRDSFVETIVFNTALIRRRLRDPRLRFEIVKVGVRSQTDVAVAYIQDIANPDLVNSLKTKLNAINIDGVPMAEKAIEEYIVGGFKWNPLPKVRYTERPDVAVTHLLEGHVLILTDTSPTATILPTTLFHHVQHVEEYRQNALVGTYLRWVRIFGMLFAFLLPPLWLAMVMQNKLLPEPLAFLGTKEPGIIPLGLQFILAEFGVELVRMATVHVPTAQSTALGFIGAFMLGEFATKVGLFANEVVFYTAIAAVGSFATPSVEFAMAIRLFRLFTIVLVMLFKLPGLIVGLGIFAMTLLFTKSFGVPYLWPLIPLNFAALKDMFIRMPIPTKVMRPSMLKPLDNDRLNHEGQTQNPKQPEEEEEEEDPESDKKL